MRTPRGNYRLSLCLAAWACLLPLFAVAMAGCGGCLGDDTAAKKKEEEEEKKKKKQRSFEFGSIKVVPTDKSTPQKLVKPGHFVATTMTAKANKGDVNAELYTEAVDQNRQPINIPNTPFRIAMSRPVGLSKGREKDLETMFYVPRETGRGSKTIWLNTRLLAAGSGRELFEPKHQPTSRMPGYQYHLVVLSATPDNFGFLKSLTCIRPPYDELTDDDPIQYYRVMLPRIDRTAPLPSSLPCWTSIAYLFWDGVDAEVFSDEQRLALLDWLHWGGQIVLNGPTSLDALKGSFLEDYLPATKLGTVSLDATAFEEMNEHWSLAEEKTGHIHTLKVVADRPVLGVSFEMHPQAAYVPKTGQLCVERRVGRGRIVMTAFSVHDRDVMNWQCFDGFMNSCLLRRPARRFQSSQLGSPKAMFAWHPNRERESRFSTGLRYFSRDIGPFVGEAMQPQAPPQDWHFDGHVAVAELGFGAWNDASGAASESRQSLQKAAGISIPNAGFVLRILAVYLVVLVPINWSVFRLLGRVEWAWIAAPLISIVGAVAVVQMAQLDIGFVRSRTEIGVLEIQSNYDRGHLTRYTALYSSLSTPYDFEFEDPAAVARPFATAEASFSRFNEVEMRRESQSSQLKEFLVDSNSTGMVHSEHSLALGGKLHLEGSSRLGYQIRNDTKLDLRDAGVLRRTGSGQVELAWIGDIAANSTLPLSFQPAATPWFDNWEKRPETSENRGGLEGIVSLHRLMKLAAERLILRPGDVRLVGWTDKPTSGLKISPEASQTVVRTLVLAHLEYGGLPMPQRDTNLLNDVKSADDADTNSLEVLPKNNPPRPPNSQTQDPRS